MINTYYHVNTSAEVDAILRDGLISEYKPLPEPNLLPGGSARKLPERNSCKSLGIMGNRFQNPMVNTAQTICGGLENYHPEDCRGLTDAQLTRDIKR